MATSASTASLSSRRCQVLDNPVIIPAGMPAGFAQAVLDGVASQQMMIMASGYEDQGTPGVAQIESVCSFTMLIFGIIQGCHTVCVTDKDFSDDRHAYPLIEEIIIKFEAGSTQLKKQVITTMTENGHNKVVDIIERLAYDQCLRLIKQIEHNRETRGVPPNPRELL